jgi:RNA polymerase sigma factor (sigma-70 family)
MPIERRRRRRAHKFLARGSRPCHKYDMEILKRHIRRMQDILRRRGQSREDAEDLIQEAFLRLLVYCQSKEVRKQEAFLMRAMQNLAVDWHRRKHRDLYVQDSPEELLLADMRPTPDEDLANQQRLYEVAAVLDRLPPRTREVFIMHRLEGFGCAQIATTFGISLSAVEKHIARAVLALMEVVKQ